MTSRTGICGGHGRPRALARILVPLLALTALPAGGAPGAEDSDFVRNRVAFSVTRSREVANDHLTAVLAASHEASDAATAASRVNETMAWALERLRSEAREGVRFRTGAYTTRRIHTPPPTRQERWRVEQELVLESGEAEAVRTLATELQARLELRSLDSSLSPERLAETRREVVADALRAFRTEADHIRKTLGFADYEIVELDLSGTSDRPPHPLLMRSAAAEADTSAVAPLALEPGWSDVRVTLTAHIQLQ